MNSTGDLYARTVEIADPGDLDTLFPGALTTVWLRRGDGMVGSGEILRTEFESIADAEAWWKQTVGTIHHEGDLGLAGSGPVAFGSFTFDQGHTGMRSVLVVPRVVVGRRDGRCWATVTGTSPDDLAVPELGHERPGSPGPISYADGALSGPAWEGVVAEAVERIRRGDLGKVVLARELLATADAPIDPRWVVTRLASAYERCWTFLVDGMVGASPEMLVRREAGLATSRVLAGTIQRTADADADRALAVGLARSSKDLGEHEYAVESVAKALAPHCTGMNVPDTPYVLELPNVFHLASDVTAVAGEGVTSMSLAAALHPSAAVCGTPTHDARLLIREIEGLDRGRYAGPVGWVDASGDGEWAIALRCGRLDGRQARLYAGCGIVADSDPMAELAETNAKLVPMRDALEG
ncbi:chorismate-binding protein [Mariniluteicoccus endophyticus]